MTLERKSDNSVISGQLVVMSSLLRAAINTDECTLAMHSKTDKSTQRGHALYMAHSLAAVVELSVSILQSSITYITLCPLSSLCVRLFNFAQLNNGTMIDYVLMLVALV